MTGKKEEVRAEVPIIDLKEGEMVGKLHENRETRNGRPSDQLIVKFIVTTFVQMSINDLKEGEMAWKLHENRKTRNGRPSDQLIVKFIVTTFVQM